MRTTQLTRRTGPLCPSPKGCPVDNLRLRGVGGSQSDRRKVTRGRAGRRRANSRRRTTSHRGCPTVVRGRPWQSPTWWTVEPSSAWLRQFKTTPHPLRDTCRPPPRTAPTHLQHHLFETPAALVPKPCVHHGADPPPPASRGEGPLSCVLSRKPAGARSIVPRRRSPVCPGTGASARSLG